MKLAKFNFDYKPHKQGLTTVLGELEAEIMQIIWEKGKVTVRDVYEHMRTYKRIASTTVNTIMKRLADKGFLDKDVQGSAFTFSPSMNRQEFAEEIVRRVLESLYLEFPDTTVSEVNKRIKG